MSLLFTLWRGPLRRPAGKIVLFAVRRLLMGLLLRTIRYVRRSAAPTADFNHIMRSSPLLNRLVGRRPVFLLLIVFVVVVVVVIWMVTENWYTAWIDITRWYCQLSPRKNRGMNIKQYYVTYSRYSKNKNIIPFLSRWEIREDIVLFINRCLLSKKGDYRPPIGHP